MSTPETEPLATRSEREVQALRDELAGRSAFDGYARLWGPVAVASLGLIVKPIMDDQRVNLVEGTIERRFGSLWETAANANGDPAVLGILLGLVLIVLAVVATFRPRSTGVPLVISAVCVPTIVMLITRPATGHPTPPLSPDGTAGLVLAAGACVLGIVHAVHHDRYRRTSRSGASVG